MGKRVTGDIVIAAEPFSGWYAEAHALFEAHWLEVEPEAGLTGSAACALAYAPNWDAMFALEKVGAYRTWTVRVGEGGRVVGYIGALMAPHLHARNHFCAAVDAICLDPEYRKGWTASLLIAQAEDDLFAAGAARILIEVPDGHELGVLLKRRGYRPKTNALCKERPPVKTQTPSSNRAA